MAVTAVYDNWADVKILPIHSVGFGWTNSGEDYSVEFGILETDSSWSLDMLTAPNDLGQPRLIGWQLQVAAIVPVNRYEEMRPWLERIATIMDVPTTPIAMQLTLKAQPGQLGGAEMFVGMPAPMVGFDADVPETIPRLYAKSWGITWSIESAEWRPRLTIRVTGMFDRDAIRFGSPVPDETHGWGFLTQGEGF